MKLSTAHGALGWALVLLSAPFCEASLSHNHRHVHQQIDKRHSHTHHHGRAAEDAAPEIVKKSTCAFPDDDPNMVAITPGEDNGGWAMSPDQTCEEDMYCPFACKPGMVMNQWDPDSTVSYPSSMNGGLYCGKGGKVSKPFPDQPNCVQGTGSVKAVSKAGKSLSFCQTIYPGNEAMIIPTLVDSVGATIAVPDTNYWCETSAHFYINPPGSGESDCKWGDDTVAIGNWSPYVAGANTDSSGNTFLKVGWNPEWQKVSILSSQKVEFGVKVECPDGGCTGLPCGIKPGGTKEGLVESLLTGTGDAGNDYCVVTVQKGSTANIVAYTDGGDSGSDDDDTISVQAEEEEEEPEPTTTAEPTTSTPEPEPTTETPTSTPEPTTSEEPTSTSVSSSTPTPTPTTTSTSSSSTSKKSKPSVKPGIFHEQNNSTSSYEDSHSVTLPADAAEETSGGEAKETEDEKDEAGRPGRSPAFAGLLIAFIAAACFF